MNVIRRAMAETAWTRILSALRVKMNVRIRIRRIRFVMIVCTRRVLGMGFYGED